MTRRDAAQRFKELAGAYVPDCCLYKLQHVRSRLSFQDLSLRHGGMTADQVAAIRSSRLPGETIKSLAERHNVSINMLYKYFRRYS